MFVVFHAAAFLDLDILELNSYPLTALTLLGLYGGPGLARRLRVITLSWRDRISGPRAPVP